MGGGHLHIPFSTKTVYWVPKKTQIFENGWKLYLSKIQKCENVS